MTAFWLRANLEGTPRVLIRRLVDDQGRVRLERRNAAGPDWVETGDLSYTGGGGGADWDTVTPELAAAVLAEWPGEPLRAPWRGRLAPGTTEEADSGARSR